MSAICLFTPVIMELSWPALSGLATAALTAAGYKVADKVRARGGQEEAAPEHSVELQVRQAGDFAQSLGEDDELVFVKDGLKISFRKTADGRLRVCASSPGMKEKELKAEGQKAVNAFVQAYAREKVRGVLMKRGFLLEEEKLADGSIRLLARKWG